MHLVGDGMVKQIRTKTGQIPIEHRLTAFDALWHSPRLAVFFAIVVWVFLHQHWAPIGSGRSSSGDGPDYLRGKWVLFLGLQ